MSKYSLPSEFMYFSALMSLPKEGPSGASFFSLYSSTSFSSLPIISRLLNSTIGSKDIFSQDSFPHSLPPPPLTLSFSYPYAHLTTTITFFFMQCPSDQPLSYLFYSWTVWIFLYFPLYFFFFYLPSHHPLLFSLYFFFILPDLYFLFGWFLFFFFDFFSNFFHVHFCSIKVEKIQRKKWL